MTSHLLTHTGEKKLRCQFCDRMFARSSDLKQHQYQHTKECEFRCEHPDCGKVFYIRKNYKKHRKLHLSEREYACDKCHKLFSTKYHKDRHMATCKAWVDVSSDSGATSDVVSAAWREANTGSGDTTTEVATSHGKNNKTNKVKTVSSQGNGDTSETDSTES